MDYQSIMKELANPSHSPARSGKDLTCRKVFSCKAGQLLPILCEELVPNDYFEIDTASLVRTFRLKTAAFVRAKVHFDFFFVPKTAIWRNWDRFYYQRNDHESSYQKSFAYEPNIPLMYICEECDTARHVSGDAFDTPAHRAKLAQMLGYGKIGYTSPSDWLSGGQYYSIKDKSLTVLPIMGYHRIYNMFYRNAWRDEPTSYDANMYSADNWDCSSYANSLFQNNYPCGATDVNSPSFFQVHYHGWYSDFFMGSLPNQQFGSVSSINVASLGNNLSVAVPNQSSQANVVFNPNTGSSTGGQLFAGTPGSSTILSLSGNLGSFDVMALRKALALQKWKEYNMRAGWKNRNQARAMFGVSTPEDRKHEIEFLKGYEFPVMIDEVVSQNGATGGNLAELAGKGIGVGNGELLKFNSGERHGYLYCIAYVMPQAEYDAVGIEKSLVRSEPFDHYVAAFENLGMEPIYKYELNAAGNASYFDSVIGYAPRYHEYKTRVDKVYGEFMATGSLDSWVATRRDLQAAANSGTLPMRLFYVNPGVLDTVFAFSAGSDETTDQFILNVNIRDKAVRPMSDLGLPNL